MSTTEHADSLIDKFGRKVDYIRLSVTDRCDFRCVYCMTEDMTFLPRTQILSLEELYRVAKVFTELGVKKIRLTGGEPMVRTDVMTLIERLGALPGLEELLLTTNGAQLDKYAVALKSAGVSRINISIDSLDAERFKRISRVGKLEKVLSGIDACIEAGIKRIRLNSVIMRGYNEDEVLALTEYALDKGIDIAFIEEMPLGETSDHNRKDTTCSNDWVRNVIEEKYDLNDSAESTAGPSRYVRVAGHESRVGFISPVTHNFCEDCNRVRVTVEGRLLLCLGNEHSVDLRDILRDESKDDSDLKKALIDSMDLKPERHYFFDDDHAQPVRLMNMTGG
ncbi:MAG: GTP 3',8-cyclase MoaA [Gammaproteobacteria bacterium]|jgi:cyclic pyranopterin phosphate synthase|nr:GTP 3',8-cyclase MoaA [Gammaproteobacteria bacterium]MBT3859541.1 GTP 3',8-cyclase MoaA [Gammaproteobacteria bacterium]MBT3986565.1 GTP 3',8-cyclase MoaA [Gammaproteobacteria bacterium]MBT4256652.1 GTP 3',8-cyclase MoaA [Gammaproteobacteria bacterium]MBT4581091.1 GTP 3',8-cyclase MoaA [Gammaproteobacteria bacterium]